MSDLRCAARRLWKSPIASAAIVASLAAGIASSTAIFSVVRGVLLHAFPYPQPDRIFDVRASSQGESAEFLLSPEFASLRQSTGACAFFAAYDAESMLVGLTDGSSERINGAEVTAGYFEVLGLRLVLGRTFVADDERLGSRAAVISTGLWHRRFGDDPSIVGRTLTIDAIPSRVIGIVEDSGPIPAEHTAVWLPMTLNGVGLRQERINGMIASRAARLPVICRGAAGVTPDQIGAELQRLDRNSGMFRGADRHIRLMPIRDRLLGRVRPLLWLLQAAVISMLGLICVNASSLLLVRSADRTRDLQVRRFLGATPGRLVRDALAEGTLIAVIGGALGCVLAEWFVTLLKAAAPSDIPRVSLVAMDWWTLGFAAACVVASSLGAASAPAFHAWWTATRRPSQPEPTRGLLAEPSPLIRRTLVAAEILLAVSLVSASVALVETYQRVSHTPLGFNPDGVLSARLLLPDTYAPSLSGRLALVHELLNDAGSGSTTTHVAVSSDVPFAEAPSKREQFTVVSRMETGPTPLSAQSSLVSPSYFDLLHIPILAGRSLSAHDDRLAPVMVVNVAFAKRYLGENAVGAQIVVGGDRVIWRVVGVCGNVASSQRFEREEPAFYRPWDALLAYDPRIPAVRWFSTLYFLAAGDASSTIAGERLRADVRRQHRELVLDEVEPLAQRIARASARTTFASTLLSLFGALSLLVASLGTYAVIAQWVSHRTKEIGIRMALGAGTSNVIRLVVTEAAWMVGAGLLAGSGLATRLAPLVNAAVPDARGISGSAVGLTVLILAIVSVIACGLPALRATRVDPAVALRVE